MAITKAKKTEQLTALVEKFKSAQGIAFTQYNGVTVNEAQEVRRELRQNGMSYTVIKKTLIAIAAKQAGVGEFNVDQLPGVVAVITSDVDAIAPAAAIKKLKKDFFDKESKTSKYDFSAALFDGELLDIAGAAALADTPTREESFGKLIGAMRKGPQGIHAGLTHGLKNITFALKEADKYTKA